jgi:hypothetical protein
MVPVVDAVEDDGGATLVGAAVLFSDVVGCPFRGVDGAVDGSSEAHPLKTAKAAASPSAAVGTCRCTSSWRVSILATSLAPKDQ